MEGLPDSVPFSSGYRYVLFHFWFITITRRSLSVAIAASCLTFVALQVCTPIQPSAVSLSSKQQLHLSCIFSARKFKTS
jgi:hypothetical protein